MQWLVVLPLEIVSATLTIEYWSHGSINSDAFVVIFLVLIIVINLFGVKGYGEAEFVFSIIKVIAVVGYIILGIILNIGGGPHGSYIGGMYHTQRRAIHSTVPVLSPLIDTQDKANTGKTPAPSTTASKASAASSSTPRSPSPAPNSSASPPPKPPTRANPSRQQSSKSSGASPSSTSSRSCSSASSSPTRTRVS